MITHSVYPFFAHSSHITPNPAISHRPCVFTWHLTLTLVPCTLLTLFENSCFNSRFYFEKYRRWEPKQGRKCADRSCGAIFAKVLMNIQDIKSSYILSRQFSCFSLVPFTKDRNAFNIFECSARWRPSKMWIDFSRLLTKIKRPMRNFFSVLQPLNSFRKL